MVETQLEDGTTIMVDNKAEIKIWKKKLAMQIKKEGKLDENLEQYYSIVIGQCTDAMKEKLKGKASFEQIEMESDCLGLLNLIREIIFWIYKNLWQYMWPFDNLSPTPGKEH